MSARGGALHREDGPAFEGSDGRKEWWLDGRKATEEEIAVFQQQRAALDQERRDKALQPFTQGVIERIAVLRPLRIGKAPL